eukprot:3773346-Rhodomonas_salina.2
MTLPGKVDIRVVVCLYGPKALSVPMSLFGSLWQCDSGTDFPYSQYGPRVHARRPKHRGSVNPPGTTVLHACYGMSGTDKRHAATTLSGTDMCYAQTKWQDGTSGKLPMVLGSIPPTVLRASYAMSGTDLDPYTCYLPTPYRNRPSCYWPARSLGDAQY